MEDCIVHKYSKRPGWMFWGCFNGFIKGLCIFWEKDWGYISFATYMERIVPIVYRWMRMNPE